MAIVPAVTAVKSTPRTMPTTAARVRPARAWCPTANPPAPAGFARSAAAATATATATSKPKTAANSRWRAASPAPELSPQLVHERLHVRFIDADEGLHELAIERAPLAHLDVLL